MKKYKAKENDIKFIIKNYLNKTAQDIANIIGCSKSFVTNTWRKNGLSGKSRSKYNCDEDYF